MTALPSFPSSTAPFTLSTHPEVPLSTSCYCGAGEPVASVSWWDTEANRPDWLDACPLCLYRAVDVAWETADHRFGVDVEVRDEPDEQLAAA